MRKILPVILALIISALILSPGIYAQYYYNQFASFDGVDDYFSTPSQSELSLDTAFSIEGWLYLLDTSGANKTIISTVNSSLSSGYAVMIQGASSNPTNAGKLLLNLNGGNNSFLQTAGTRFPLNAWGHFSITFRNVAATNDTIRFYINGTLVQSFITNVQPLSNSSDPLRVGNCYVPGNFSNGLRGRIDDLRIYKTTKLANLVANDRGIPLNFGLFSNISALDGSNYYKAICAAWNFDGNGNDPLGIANNLTASGGAGFSGNYFNPDNYRNQSNFYIRFPGSSWLAAADGTGSIFDLDTACTIEAWVYIDAYRAQPQTIISKGASSYSYIFAISSSPSNSPVFILNSGSKIIQSSRNILPRVWTHLAATYRSSTGELALYVNGNLDTNRILSPGNITVSNDSALIGRSLFGEYMYGSIDGVKLSKFAKTSAEIKAFLNTSVDNLNVTGNPQLQASYNFEGNTFDNINLNNPFLPKVNIFFERLNNLAGAGGYAQAPIIRQSANDPGLTGSSFILNSGRFHIGNGTTVRDSILVSGISGSNRVAVVVLMNHTSVNDVTLNLRAPNGTSVNFHAGTGSTNNDIMTVYDDFADSLLSNTLAPFSMKCRPINLLSALPQSGQNGYWRLSVTDASGNVDSGRVYTWGIKFIPTVGINTTNNNIPGEFYLNQNYPNPFNPVTTIEFGIPAAGNTEIAVFDINGKKVESISQGHLQPGNYNVTWNASSFASGVYFLRVISGEKFLTKKMLLIK
jgi:subtilisin-like proprotein convertase family protein